MYYCKQSNTHHVPLWQHVQKRSQLRTFRSG